MTATRWIAAAAVALLAVPAVAQQATTPPPEAPAFKTQKEKVSYAIGVSVAGNLKRDNVEVDIDTMVRGLRDALAGTKLAMTETEMREVMTAFVQDLQTKQAAAQQAAAAANQKEGDAFLAKNKTQPGVVTTASGLQYKVVKAGTGKKPTANDTVSVNYRGTLISGKEFDSSAKHGGPATFKVGGVIPGWTEALKLMPVGSKWQLFIPAKLAYGDRAAGPDIGPGSTLIFDVELLSIK